MFKHLFAIDGLPAHHRERPNVYLVRSQGKRDGDGVVGVGSEIGVNHHFLPYHLNPFARAARSLKKMG
jgi:hypothetical protein